MDETSLPVTHHPVVSHISIYQNWCIQVSHFPVRPATEYRALMTSDDVTEPPPPPPRCLIVPPPQLGPSQRRRAPTYHSLSAGPLSGSTKHRLGS